MIAIDTHIIIWSALKPEALSPKTARAIHKNQKDGIIISEISLREIAMLMKKKRLIIEVSFLEFIDLIKSTNNYLIKGITSEIADLSVNFPAEINPDPADRIICATAKVNNSFLVTAYKNLIQSQSVETIW